MKFPKNRANIYIVTRGEVVCGVFASYEEADNFCAACEQEWYDKTGAWVPEHFKVQVSTFYG